MYIIECNNIGTSSGSGDIGDGKRDRELHLGASTSTSSSFMNEWQSNLDVISTEAVAVESVVNLIRGAEPVPVVNTVSTDPGEWVVINDATIEYLLLRNIEQNLNEDFSATRTFYPSLNSYRSLSKKCF